MTTNETARYTLTIGSETVTQADPKGLESLSCEDHLDMIGVCELTIAGGLGTTWNSLKMGDPVTLMVGGSTYKVFDGVITSLRSAYQHGRDTLVILAMDPLAKLAASRATNSSLDNMKDSDVVSKLIQDAGGQVGQIDPTSETHTTTSSATSRPSRSAAGTQLATRPTSCGPTKGRSTSRSSSSTTLRSS